MTVQFELGQDVEHVETVLAALVRQQRALTRSRDQVEDAARQLERAWHGPDAVRGTRTAHASARTVSEAAGVVAAMTSALREQIEEQRAASGMGGADGGGVVPPSGPVPAPTSPTSPTGPGTPGVHGPDWAADELARLSQPLDVTPEGAAAAEEQRRAEVRELFDSLSPQEAALLATTHPAVVGNLPGVPFEYRADANAVNVSAALAAERAELQQVRDQHERNQHDWDFLGINNDDLEGRIEELERRTALYESILRDDRQILFFDPSGDGAIAEMHGTIGERTTNVGVLVPGTGADLATFQGNADRSVAFVENDPREQLVMVSWMGGDLPDDIIRDAPFANYSVDLGPKLADFSRDLDQEVRHSEAPGSRVTVAGHSYGRAVVGLAEQSGLVADRVLHIESAGMGHDVSDVGDLPASQQDVDRYSMTAPGDVIGLVQGAGQPTDNIGHGADPDTFAGVTRLDTGDRTDGTPNTGLDSHSEVFQEHSDAWENMFQVFTGGTVETYRTPDYSSPLFVGLPHQVGWNDDGQRIDIE